MTTILMITQIIYRGINRFLSGLLGVVNIIAIVPVIALVFGASKDQLGEVIGNTDAVIFLSIFLALAAVGLINGLIASMLNLESELRKRNTASVDPDLVTPDLVTPDLAAPAKKASSKSASSKSAASAPKSATAATAGAKSSSKPPAN